MIHFRWASVGEVTPKLCHPFPVSAKATTRLSGHARSVLFHNGTWSQWRETLRRMPMHRMPDGLLSDTRVAASLVDLCGIDTLDRLPGRWVFFDRDFTELYGDWREWRGMRASNLGFTYGLTTRPSFLAAKHTQCADDWHQPFLEFPDTCGTSDTLARRMCPLQRNHEPKTDTMKMNYQFPIQQTHEEPARTKGPLVTEIELSNYMKICRRQLYNWRMARLIPYIKLGKAVRFRLSDVEHVLETLTIGKP